MSKIFLISFVSLLGNLALTACTNTTVTDESTNNGWSTFESPVVGIRFQYPSELEWSLRETEVQGFDKGYRRRYSFSGTVDGTDVSFSLDATTSDFGYGISEGCCWAFGGPAIDLSKSDEEIVDDLARGTESILSKEDPGNWKLLEVYNLEHLTLGTQEFLRFADLGGFIGYSLGDNYLTPHAGHEFTNIIVSWRGSEMFTNLEGELSSEEFFAQIEDFANNWMKELSESEKREKEIVESILFTLEFVEFEPESIDDTGGGDLAEILTPLEGLSFNINRPFDSFVEESDSMYMIWFGREWAGGLIFYKEPLATKVIPEGSTAYQRTSSGVTLYCTETSCVIAMDDSDEYYRLDIVDEGFSSSDRELLKEYIKTIEVR